MSNNAKLPIITGSFTLLFALCCVFLGFAGIQKDLQNFTYDIFLEGKKIGSMALSLSETEFQGQSVLKINAHSKIKIKVLFMTIFSLESEEGTLINDAGAFAYTSRSKIDGDSVVVVGYLENGLFEFDQRINKKSETIAIKRSDYDFTSSDTAEDSLKEVSDSQTFRVLDLDRLQVVEHTLKWLRNEELRVAGELILCRVIEFNTPYERGTRWITDDQFGLLVKEIGVDEDGEYAVEISKLE